MTKMDDKKTWLKRCKRVQLNYERQLSDSEPARNTANCRGYVAAIYQR